MIKTNVHIFFTYTRKEIQHWTIRKSFEISLNCCPTFRCFFFKEVNFEVCRHSWILNIKKMKVQNIAMTSQTFVASAVEGCKIGDLSKLPAADQRGGEWPHGGEESGEESQGPGGHCRGEIRWGKHLFVSFCWEKTEWKLDEGFDHPTWMNYELGFVIRPR